MTEFQYQKAEIIERINRNISSDETLVKVIKDIIFRPGKVTKSVPFKSKARPTTKLEPLKELTNERKGFIEKTVAPIKDKDLRELITRTMSRSNDQA